MDHATRNKIVSFIWSIADDCLRDVFVRGKYRDVILPMFVLRRIDCLLEDTKEAVLAEVKFQKDEAGMALLDPDGLREASGQVFYNTSKFTLKSLLGNPSQLEANFNHYLDGFSSNVAEIIAKFDLRNQIRKMGEADALHGVIEKFVAPDINLSHHDAIGPDGRKLPGLTNLGMGYVFEELIRKFNEENNEEAGEHFTPREVIQLMIHLLFEPVKKKLPPVITIYDPACGSGGMLTEAQDFIIDPEGSIRSKAAIYLYGKEVNPETYAICKSDMMIKGNNPENIRYGSTLATDEFSGTRFDFMLSNPPYGKSWKTDQGQILEKNGANTVIIDPRFEVKLPDASGEIQTVSAAPAVDDGQLLFLMEMVSKMKRLQDSPAGSRIATVHNGSALFTGNAGGGASNIRQYWKVTVERPLRKSAQFSAERIAPLRFDKSLATEMEWIFSQWGEDVYKKDFLTGKKEAAQRWLDHEQIELTGANLKKLLDPKLWLARRELLEIAGKIHKQLGEETWNDFTLFTEDVRAALKNLKLKPGAPQLKTILDAVSWRDPDAEPIVAKELYLEIDTEEQRLTARTWYPVVEDGSATLYEPDSELRDLETETEGLLEQILSFSA